MTQKLQTEAGRALYRMRKKIVEPVFGHAASTPEVQLPPGVEDPRRVETDLPDPERVEAVPIQLAGQSWAA